ncbi:MAG TPA: ribosome silencing factor [Rhizomicrobium sp.]|nr:ribosome silencing factor [Rhizomicrobium sp.]
MSALCPRDRFRVHGGQTLTRKITGAKKAPARAKAARSAAKTSSKKPVSRKVAAKKAAPPPAADDALLDRIRASLDADKAEDIVTIALAGRSSLADALVIATGRSSRHVASIAEHLARKLKESGYGTRPVSGAAQGDWVLVDAGDVIVHIFRAEVRDYYDLEGMWSVEEPVRSRA